MGKIIGWAAMLICMVIGRIICECVKADISLSYGLGGIFGMIGITAWEIIEYIWKKI